MRVALLCPLLRPRASGPRSVEAACDELDGLLAQSLKEQLVSDLPVGIWLSGGLDSSTILHYAANAHQRSAANLFHYFPGTLVRREQIHQGGQQPLRHAALGFDLTASADLVDAIERIAYYSDEPGADAGALPLWFLAQMTSRDVTVVLTGEGADELFGGYLTYQADRYMRSGPPDSRSAAAGSLGVCDASAGVRRKDQLRIQGSNGFCKALCYRLKWRTCSGTEHFRRLRSNAYSCSPMLDRSPTCSPKWVKAAVCNAIWTSISATTCPTTFSTK